MRRLALRFSTALLTFAIGVTIAFVWVIPHFQPSKAPQVTKKLEGSAKQNKIDCSNRKQIPSNTIEGEINLSKKSSWKWDETRVSDQESLDVIKFTNANEGWIGGSKEALYKTTDAGRTWQKIKLDVLPDSSVNSISFINSSVGWIVVSRIVDVFEKNGRDNTKSWVLNTTDGGKSWQTQYYDKALRIFQVKFVNEQEGWAIGDKIINYGYDGFIIHTTDGGKHWTDVSAKAYKKEGGNLGSIDYIYAEEPSKALILKFSKQFYSTNDGGQSWQQAASLPEEPPQAFLDRISILGDNYMWAVGGADSIEGMWGTLARMDNDCSWTKYSIGGVYFSDAAFPSDKDIFVCGAIPSLGRDKVFESRSRDGMILHSPDGGRNWTIVYRNSHTSHINSLAVADSNNVWAVGESGYIIHLQPSNMSNN